MRINEYEEKLYTDVLFILKDALRFVVNSLFYVHKFQYKIGELTQLQIEGHP
jgi:hypothetical protein